MELKLCTRLVEFILHFRDSSLVCPDRVAHDCGLWKTILVGDAWGKGNNYSCLAICMEDIQAMRNASIIRFSRVALVCWFRNNNFVYVIRYFTQHEWVFVVWCQFFYYIMTRTNYNQRDVIYACFVLDKHA